MKLRNCFKLLMFLAITASTSSHADGLNWSLSNGTPVGSWQLREDTMTDHKGRQTVSVVKTSMLTQEMRDGEKYYWIEMVMNSFKVKKDKRKKSGDQSVIKALVPASMMSSDPANAMMNLRSFGKEIIMQSGDSNPMLIRGAGGFADGMLKGMGAEINYDFQRQGTETVNTPAGSFSADKLVGSGTTTMKILFKTLTVTSNTTAWYAKNVPFGMVKTEGSDVTNGKRSTHSSELLEFGRSGASSVITKTPEELPPMPSMKDLFGR